MAERKEIFKWAAEIALKPLTYLQRVHSRYEEILEMLPADEVRPTIEIRIIKGTLFATALLTTTLIAAGLITRTEPLTALGTMLGMTMLFAIPASWVLTRLYYPEGAEAVLIASRYIFSAKGKAKLEEKV